MTMINVKKYINDSFSSISGHSLGKTISEALGNDNKQKIILDFNSMSPFTSLFFNAMLEELISQGNIKVINDSLIIRNLSSLDIKTYKRCLNSAIQHQVKLDAD